LSRIEGPAADFLRSGSVVLVLLFEVALSVHHVVVTQHAGWSITKANAQAQVVADETAHSRCKLFIISGHEK
jgi:cell division protein FtsL